MRSLFVLLLWACVSVAHAGAPSSAASIIETTETIDNGAGQPMSLLVFTPAQEAAAPRAAIMLFHGGGWTVGRASWMASTARLMADAGLVAISVDYRLSGKDDATPYESVADARAAVRWTRRNAGRLGIDPARIAAGGSSAGAHIAASIAVFDEPFGDEISARPDALVLWSPAVSGTTDRWFTQLVGGPARAAALSPDLHVHAGVPATIILQGAEDSVTPAAYSQRFCERMQQVGNRCEVVMYPGVGHLFTRNLQQQETPDFKALDREIGAEADQQALRFLQALDFIGS